MERGEAIVALAKITSKGQVTVPQEIRKALGAKEGDEIMFTVTGQDTANIRILKHKPLMDLYGVLPATKPFTDSDKLRAYVRTALANRVAQNGNDE